MIETAKPKILLVDDEESVCGALEMILGEDYQLIPVVSGESALAKLEADEFDLVMLDITLAGDMNGFSVLNAIKTRGIATPVVMITSDNSAGSMIKAIDQFGAEDYISKPPDIEKTVRTVEGVINQHRMGPSNNNQEFDDGIVGESEKMKEVKSLIRYVAPTDLAVLIEGKTGVGKELLAKAIHNLSFRKNKPFVVVNCAAVPEGVLESELFGHEKGAFTDAKYQRRGKFEISDGGTLFIDEIGEAGASVQVKLLRVLQEKVFARVGSNKDIQVDVRVIAATNRDIKEDIGNGRFRDDLYYRLCGVVIKIPSLDERRDDIPVLVRHFLATHGGGRQNMTITSKGMDRLISRNWPGNVRELENVIRRGIAFTRGNVIDVENMALENGIVESYPSTGDQRQTHGEGKRRNDDVWDRIRQAIQDLVAIEGQELAVNSDRAKKSLERKIKKLLAEVALENTGQNYSKAGRIVGVDHKTILKWKVD